MRSQRLPGAAVWPPVLACGAWLKNAACLLQGDEVLWSPVHGDLGDPQSCRDLEASLEALLAALDAGGGKPVAIAHDLHPDFYSSQLAVQLAARLGVPALAVQHHHAHIAALLAEHGLRGPALGLALDGVGLGSDGAAWGGGLLWVGARARRPPRHLPPPAPAWGAALLWVAPHPARRLGPLLPLALPAGDVAAREPWRLVAAALHQLGRGAEIVPRLAPLVGERAAGTVANMLQRDLNCPPSSGAGRWFDAAAGILGISVRQEFEAQAAIALDRQASDYVAEQPAPAVDGLWHIDAAGVLDLRPLLERLFVLADAGRAGEGAALFHLTLAAALADACARHPGLPVLLGGGCFANRLLSRELAARLAARDIPVFAAQSVPCGDAGLALGQAWVAAHWPALDQLTAAPSEELPPCV